MKRFWETILVGCLAASGVLAQTVSLTVYNDDLAVVRVEEDMQFTRGRQVFTLTDVAERIDPTSVRLKALDGGVTIHEQNFRYDLVNSQKVLERYLDRGITVWLNEGELIEGTLQSVSGDVVIQNGAGGITIVKPDAIQRFEFPELPEGLITRPTLFWDITSTSEGMVPTEISYMTGGFNWHAEYTVVVNDDESEMELSSWVSVQNQSGATYRDTTLKLVAGEVHRARQPTMERMLPLGADMIQEAAPSGFEERALFEYHLYELEGRTTVQNNEIKQIALFEPTIAAVQILLIFDPQVDQDNVTAMIEFVNRDEDGLGMPLPAGVVRVYTRDTDGAIEFVGEDRIDHTPEDEEVRLTLGSSFDITAERRVMETQRISQRVRDDTIEIELRNRKDEPVTITAVEHLWGSWDIVRTTDTFTRKDAYTAECTVTLPARTEKIIAFTVRYQ
ncbi:DUF4139 domain-containing protein [Candidatus Latescibacterota bacterium]